MKTQKKVYNLDKYSSFFLQEIHEEHLSLKDADDEQSNFAAKTKNVDKGQKAIEKYFLK